MATTPSSKQSKIARSRSHRPETAAGLTLPLVVDPRELSVMAVERLYPETAEKFLARSPEPLAVAAVPRGHKKKVPRRAEPGMYFVVGKSAVSPESPKAIWRNLDQALVRSVVEKTLESLKEVHLHQAGKLTTGQFIRQVAQTLADKADVEAQEVSVEQGWQQLLEGGLRSKISLLQSAQFKTTSSASELLGIKEAAVRRRIREKKLFALKMPVDGDHRIPAWALDPWLAGASTATLLEQAGSADEWHVYHFMSTPNGTLNGLRPFECLLSNENLPRSRQALKGELVSYLGLPAHASLLETVKQALTDEIREGMQT